MSKQDTVVKPREHREKDKKLEAAKNSVKIKTDNPLGDKSIRTFIERTEGKQYKDI